LVNDPWLILADEPSGALDDDNAQTVGRLLTQTAKSRGAGVVIATHDPDLVELGDRRLRLAHGRLAAL
jgi:ABC-type lipoprotein export system ATPase subunit